MTTKLRILTALLSVALVGSAAASILPGSTASAAASPLTNTIHRLAGSDRYATNLAIVGAGWSKSDAVCIAFGGNFPDALSGSALAGALNCPLLLVPGSDTSAACKEIKALQATTAYIFGGTGVVPAKVESQLKAAGIASIIRYGGVDRYATSSKIAMGVVDANNAKGIVTDTAVIATGTGFADALSIAPEAGMLGYPVILTTPDTLSPAADVALGKIKPAHVIIVGGTGAVSQAVQNTIAAKYTKNITRLGGKDRYATSAAIATAFMGKLDNTRQCFATGDNFPDALGGASFAAHFKAPVLLVAPGSTSAAYTFVTKTGKTAFNAYAFGGTAVLSNDTVNAAYGKVPPAPHKKPSQWNSGPNAVPGVYGYHLSKDQINQVESKAKSVVSQVVTPGMDDYQKYKTLAIWLMNHCYYDNDARAYYNTAYGSLILGYGQCSGYARGYKALCDAAGLECYYVHCNSQAWNPSHQFNVVYCGGGYYVVDTQEMDTGMPGAVSFGWMVPSGGNVYLYDTSYSPSLSNTQCPEAEKDDFSAS